jgi:hypothetical protein
MKNRKTVLTAFWHGYGAVLDIFPAHRPNPKRFMFRGLDLSTISATEALEQDWRMVGSSIASALNEVNEREDERREIEQCIR